MERAPEMNPLLSTVGLLFDGREEADRRFLGSCFCVTAAGVFVTAAHCLDHVPLDRLWINHFGGPEPHAFTPAKSIDLIREADTAVVVTDAPNAKWVRPFGRVRFFANLGEPVCALGYPFGSVQVDVPPRETFRFFRGHIQRPFVHRSPRSGGARYSAYELSFPCPFGLSGGPVFLAEDPTTVIGVVTEDLEVGTTLREDVEEAGGRVREVRRVVNYGVAANIIAAADMLERILGGPLPVVGVTVHTDTS